MRRFDPTRLAAAVALSMIGGASACAQYGTPSDNRIAVAADFTTNTTSSIGEALRFGAAFAADQEGLAIEAFDDKNTPGTAIANALRIVADKRFVAVIGHGSSGMTAQAEAVYGRYGVPLLMPVATASDITLSASKEFRRLNAFRLVPNNDAQADELTDLAMSQAKAHFDALTGRPNSKPFVLFVHETNAYGADLGHKVMAHLLQKSDRLLVSNDNEVPEFLPSANFIDIVKLAEEYHPDVVLFIGYYGNAAVLIRQLRARFADLPMVLADGSFQPALFAGIGANRRDIFITFPAPDWRKAPAVNAMLASYQKEPSVIEGLSFAPFAADAVTLIARVVKQRAAGDPRLRLLDALSKGTKMPGLTGEYTFNPKTGESERGRFYVYRLSDERAVFEMVER